MPWVLLIAAMAILALSKKAPAASGASGSGGAGGAGGAGGSPTGDVGGVGSVFPTGWFPPPPPDLPLPPPPPNPPPPPPPPPDVFDLCLDADMTPEERQVAKELLLEEVPPPGVTMLKFADLIDGAAHAAELKGLPKLALCLRTKATAIRFKAGLPPLPFPIPGFGTA